MDDVKASSPVMDVKDFFALFPMISKPTIYRGIREGKIPSITICERKLIPRSYVDQLLAAAKTPAEVSA